jgi:hypothetical protein
MKDLVTKEDCNGHVKNMVEKIDKIKDSLTSFELKVTEQISRLPQKLEDRFDKRYADIHTEKDVDNINKNINRLVWIVITGVVLGILNLVVK